MPKRTGAQGAGERVGEVVQLTGKLSQWRVRDTPLLPHTNLFSPDRTSPSHLHLTPSYMRSLSRPTALSPPTPYPPPQVSHGRQPGAECVSQARDQAAVQAVEGAKQRWGQCGRRVMCGATVLTWPRPPPTWCCLVFVAPLPQCRPSQAEGSLLVYSYTFRGRGAGRLSALTVPCVHCRRHKSVEAHRMVPRVGPPPTPRFLSRPPADRLAAIVESWPPPLPFGSGVGPPPPPASTHTPPSKAGVTRTRRSGLRLGSLEWA